jgi:agmatinase
VTLRDDAAARFGLQSFMGAPLTRDLSGAKAAILGVPYDSGTHAARIGARLGPASIREQSVLIRAYEPPAQDFDPLQALGAVDCGNVSLVPSSIRESFAAIEAAVHEIASAGVTPVTMGGDGAVTLPQLRALARCHRDLVVLHIDAHTDTFPEDGADRIRYSTATTFTRAAEEGLVEPGHSWHLGARGPTYRPDAWGHALALGYNVIPDHEMRDRGIAACAAAIRDGIGDRPVYLCFDMDIFDPSCAPGVCTPTWGGLFAHEGLSLLRSLTGMNFVSFDVNTVSPPHDSAGMTAYLASAVMREFLFLAAARHS